MKPDETRTRVPDWILERYLLDELDATEARRIAGDLERDPALRERLESLRRSDLETLERYPAARMAEEIRRRSEMREPSLRAEPRRRPPIRLWPIPAVSLAAVALVVLAFSPPIRGLWSGESPHPTNTGITRIKGLEPQLLLIRRTEAGSERLVNGAAAREGDLILIRYEAAGWAYGAIVSVDGLGTVTRHLPVEGTDAVRLDTDGAVSLDFAYELDDAPRWERFYFITAEAPFRLEAVMAAARGIDTGAPVGEADSLRLPGLYGQSIFTLVKEVDHE